ncbi:hypothetical protein RHOSPDRAFT_36636 [Rhodotorula sp. JG-1b]|nr:hypothetical protein RHOSPDRAFT_36636 [Rhodotorula sp. JG-1b]
MGLLHKLRRRKRNKNAEASAAAASLLLPALPFNDDDKLAELEDKGTQTSNDSGYGSAENASPTFATTPAELSASEDQEHSSSEDLKFAQLVNLEQDVVNRRRRESIRFELFGTDDDDDGEEEGEAQEGASIQSGARPPPRPRLNICTSVAGRRPPTAITPVSADSPQLQAYRPPPTRHSYSSTSWSTTTCSYFQPRYHTWASQRLLDITHERIAASRRRSEAFPPVPAADARHSVLAPPSSTHAPATLREMRSHAPKDPLRVRLARSVMLVKLRNGLTSDEAGELCFGPASRVPGSIKPPSYSAATSERPAPCGTSPSLTTAPHPLALVLPRLPAWAHRPTYQERCVVTRPDQDGSEDETPRPEEERERGARPGSATVSSRVATFVAELAEHERLQSQFTPAVAIDTPNSSRPPRAPPPSCRVPAQSGNSSVSSLPMRVQHETFVPHGLGGATISPPAAVVEDLLATSRTVLIPARPSRPVRVRTYDDSSRPSSTNNNNHHHDDNDDDDERPLAMLRRSASTSCLPERLRAVDGDLLGTQQVPLPFWLPPLISATAAASRTHSSTAWRPLSNAGSSANSGPRRGVIVAVPRGEVAPVRPSIYESDPNDTGSLPPVTPSVVVCTPAKARQLARKPAPGSLYWPTTTMAPKSLSFPPLERSRTREMPIAAKRPDLRSRHSSIELHGSFKVIEHDFQFPSKSKRPWTRSLSLRKARSFWHVGEL